MCGDLEKPKSYSRGLKRMLRRGASWLLRLMVVAVSLLTLFIVLTPQGRAGFHTALFVAQTLEIPIKPQSWFTDDSLRVEVSYRTVIGMALADIYRLPDGNPRAAVVLSLGANETGCDDPDVINLGHALAKAGYVVMFHWSPKMGLHANIDADEPEKLVQAFQYLEGRDYVDPERVGLGGFCIGASLALVAASTQGSATGCTSSTPSGLSSTPKHCFFKSRPAWWSTRARALHGSRIH